MFLNSFFDSVIDLAHICPQKELHIPLGLIGNFLGEFPISKMIVVDEIEDYFYRIVQSKPEVCPYHVIILFYIHHAAQLLSIQ